MQEDLGGYAKEVGEDEDAQGRDAHFNERRVGRKHPDDGFGEERHEEAEGEHHQVAEAHYAPHEGDDATGLLLSEQVAGEGACRSAQGGHAHKEEARDVAQDVGRSEF